MRVVADSYRASEIRNLVLPVSGRLIQNFKLRLLTDIWQTGMSRSILAGKRSILAIYGPDVDLSRSAYIERSPERLNEFAPSLSRDVSSEEILNLPLAKRNPYALVVLQPNVTNEVSTLRGLGVAANGQRPSSSAFLLDGFQNNNYVTTGVLAVLPPEAVQEYRLSINNFSAEFGSTAGYLANAITRSSSNSWHGQMYADVTNQTWNAVDPQEKQTGEPAPSQQLSFGTVLGGALLKNRLMSTTSLEWDRSRSSAEQNLYTLPTESFLTKLQQGSTVARLIAQFSSPAGPGSGDFGSLLLRPTISLHHVSAMERFDFSSKDEKSHSFARVIADRLSQPDFIWSTYSVSNSGLDRNEAGFRSLDQPDSSTEPPLRVSRGIHPGFDRLESRASLQCAKNLLAGTPSSFNFSLSRAALQSGNLILPELARSYRIGSLPHI